MSPFAESPVVRLLRSLARLALARPNWMVWPQILLFGFCVWYTVGNLQFVMDRNSLLDADLDYNKNFLAYRREFPAQADLVAVVESESREKNRQFIERLAARLGAESTAVHSTNLFTDVFYKGDLKLMGPKALLFVPETNLVELSRTLTEYQPFLREFAGSSNLASLFSRINTLIRTSPQDTNQQSDALVSALPALERIIRRAQESLQRSGAPPSPGVDALFAAGAEAENRQYITFAHGRLYLATARPREVMPSEYATHQPTPWNRVFRRNVGADTEDQRQARRKSAQETLNAQAVLRFRELVSQVQREVGGVNAGVTGESVLDYDEMIQSQSDSTLASVVSLGLVALIFIVGYRSFNRPLKATACLVIGLGYTMAFTTATVGHLNILTITFVPMLIGLAIDFGVHLITRFEEELGAGRTEPEAITTAMVFTGKGIFTGCLTTAGAFAAMAITDFRGIREMGVICGGGLVISLIPMLTMLPALLVGRRAAEPSTPGVAATPVRSQFEVEDWRARVERLWLRRPWTVIGIAAALSIAAGLSAARVRFDYNLLNMQSPELSSVQFEHKLVHSSEKSVIFGAVMATNLTEAKELEARFRARPLVGSVESMAAYLAENPTDKLPLIRQVKDTTQSLEFAEPDRRPVDLHDLSQILWSLQGYLSLAEEEVAARGRTNLLNDMRSLKDALGELRTELFRGNSGEEAQRARQLGAFQQALFDDLRETFRTLQAQSDLGGLQIADLPPALRNRFVGVTGRLLLQVYPRTNVWDREPQAAFVAELQRIEPTATGAPVQMYYYTELLKQSYIEAAGWALAAIVILVGLHFRRFASVLPALLPVGLGALWVMGLMGWVGVSFNPANIMMLPLVVGIGVTNGIHILNRFAEEQRPSILAKSTGKAVLVSGLTTIAGFGSLLLAQHQGIQSLGFVMALGTATCMIAALTVLPAILTLRRPGVRIRDQ